MPGSTNKKVVVVRFDREPATGYAPASFDESDNLEVLTPAGSILTMPYRDVKAVCFVKSWEEPVGIEERRSFGSRPRLEGLWVKALFRDGDFLELLLPNRLLDLPVSGFLGAPPDAAGNAQRVFIPRVALTDCVVLGVIGASRKASARKPGAEGQLKMFD